jgi:hypothetical protein
MKVYSELVRKIEAGGFSERELLNLYTNAQERQIAEVAAAVMVQLRDRFSRTANRVFGAKQADAQSHLEAVLADLSERFDLSANQVGSGVKAGGDMLAGKKYLDLYISYKNASSDGVLLALIQEEASSPLMVYLRIYRTGKEASEVASCWPAVELPQAAALYEERLKAIVP